MRSKINCGWGGFALVLITTGAVWAAPKYNYEHGADLAALSFQISSSDIINNLPAGSILLNPDLAAGWPFNTNGYKPICNMSLPCVSSEVLTDDLNRNAGISGFHYAFNPPDQKLKLVDGQAGVQTDCVLSDMSWPAAVFQFDLPDAPRDIGEIRVFAANVDQDGRVFQNYDVEISTDTNPDTKERVFTPLINRVMTSIVVCAAPGQGDGFIPNVNSGAQVPVIGATVTRVFDDDSAVLTSGVTSVRFTFWAVSRTGKTFADQWLGPIGCTLPDGADPATHWDPEDHDGFQRAFESSVIKEIDILPARVDPVEICDNGIDDDGDGLVDAADFECFGLTCPAEDCTNGVDDTGEGLIDCDDPDCRDHTACGGEICDDGIDNDGNGLIDCVDPDCADFPACQCADPVYDVAGGSTDGAVDMLDFAVFQRCLTTTGTDFNAIPQVCRCMDKSGPGGVPDEIIDQHDLAVFINCATGPSPASAVSPDCDD